MKPKLSWLATWLAMMVCASSVCSAALAQAYPQRPIRIVTHSAPGGFELYIRFIAPKLSEALGRPVVVENKVGANGNLAMQDVARAAADGYTLLFAATGALTINSSIYEQNPVDPIAELDPVAMVATVPMIWVAGPKSGINTLADYVQRARASPGKVNFALAANGSLNHLAYEGLKQANKLDLTTIAYKSTPNAQQDVIGGTVPVMVDSMGAAMGHLRGGSLVLLAVTTKARVEAFPNVPTVIELGFDNREYLGWYGVLAPRGTPVAIVERLNAEINKAMQSPEIVEKVKSLGAAPGAGSAEQFRQFMLEERAKWGAIARAANIKLQ